ncbi:MAG: hypothetical protein ICV73_13260 [Acetobacteraceae bacterium]|nr:hypothetical protein [Acetobacteraceae bacterium]
MTEDGKDGAPPAEPRRTYMPKPPSKEEVDQVSREQAMVTDEWTGDAPASGAEQPPGRSEPPGGAET